MEVYRYRTGVVTTEQDFITELDTFMTSYIGGWTRIETVSDTSTNRDYTWSSEGEDDRVAAAVPGADPIIVRARADGNNIYVYGYGTYESSTVNTFELYNVTYTRLSAGSSPFRYWMYGNKNFVCYIVMNTTPWVGYIGLIDSFYLPETDPLPLCVRGQYQSSYGLAADTTYAAMHNLTTSGHIYYEAMNWYTYVLSNDIANRSSNLFILPTMLRTDNADGGSNYECRGGFYGIYGVSGARMGQASTITTASGVFMGFKIAGADSTSYVFGPVASGIGEFPGMYINGTTGYSP